MILAFILCISGRYGGKAEPMRIIRHSSHLRKYLFVFLKVPPDKSFCASGGCSRRYLSCSFAVTEIVISRVLFWSCFASGALKQLKRSRWFGLGGASGGCVFRSATTSGYGAEVFRLTSGELRMFPRPLRRWFGGAPEVHLLDLSELVRFFADAGRSFPASPPDPAEICKVSTSYL
jgi:hypothetical protein